MSSLTVINHPLVHHKLTLLRKKSTPTSNFRRLLKELSLLLGFEATRDLKLKEVEIRTPLAVTTQKELDGKKLALVSVLRAGNGLLEGLQDLIPSARVGHVGLYRDHDTLQPVEYYAKFPDGMERRTVIAVDPMLATGNSIIAAVDRIKQTGAKDIRFLCLLAAPEGIKAFQEAHPDVPIITAAVDSHLTESGYIYPGLGDAGDRLYGTK
ncbi:MAG: uracil phosphoribosyltransferase [Hyphomicrobiales bacterium]|nr:MAG: uracil phosphoribosyltransferase [Hyphomicrobiales bacterium]